MDLKTLQALSVVIMVGAGLGFIALEKRYPYNGGQKTFRDGFWVDLIGYGLVQSYLMGLLISFLIDYVDNHTGLSRLRVVSDWPIWVQVAFFVVWHDLNTYLIHRAQHRSSWLWRTHEAHHSAAPVDWLSGIRSSAPEILLYETVHFLPIVLLGASPEVPLYKGMLNSIYGMYIHSNLNWRMGKLLYFINGPELHRWHHANEDSDFYGMNLATKFPIWDHLFGTYRAPKGKIAKDYGPDDPAYPKGYVGQHAYIFRPFPAENVPEDATPGAA